MLPTHCLNHSCQCLNPPSTMPQSSLNPPHTLPQSSPLNPPCTLPQSSLNPPHTLPQSSCLNPTHTLPQSSCLNPPCMLPQSYPLNPPNKLPQSLNPPHTVLTLPTTAPISQPSPHCLNHLLTLPTPCLNHLGQHLFLGLPAQCFCES